MYQNGSRGQSSTRSDGNDFPSKKSVARQKNCIQPAGPSEKYARSRFSQSVYPSRS
jgi:hypothetical protein